MFTFLLSIKLALLFIEFILCLLSFVSLNFFTLVLLSFLLGDLDIFLNLDFILELQSFLIHSVVPSFRMVLVVVARGDFVSDVLGILFVGDIALLLI